MSSLTQPLLFKLPKHFSILASKVLLCNYNGKLYSCSILRFRHSSDFSIACLMCAMRRSVLLSLQRGGSSLKKLSRLCPCLVLILAVEMQNFFTFFLIFQHRQYCGWMSGDVLDNSCVNDRYVSRSKTGW